MSPSEPHNVLIAGGGPAAVEAALRLQRVAGTRVATVMLAPEAHFAPRPMTVLEPFAAGGAERRPLGELAATAGAHLHHGTLASVDPAAHSVLTAEGETIAYDSLLLATGAVATPPFTHALAFGGPDTPEQMHGLVQDLEDGYVRRVAFIVPAGASWPLPLYELALMTAQRAYDTGAHVELTLVTPEFAPLAIFGLEPSSGVAAMLEEAGIDTWTSTHAEVPSSRAVILRPGGNRIEVDRVVTLAVLRGPRIAGLPHDGEGFLPIDRHCRVAGVDDVYAAGDATNFSVKQGGIACQQADAAADAIAVVAGVPIAPEPFRPVLRGVLLTERGRQWMHRDAAGSNDPGSITGPPLWWPATKIAGAELARHLQSVDDRPRPAGRGAVEVDLPISVG